MTVVRFAGDRWRRSQAWGDNALADWSDEPVWTQGMDRIAPPVPSRSATTRQPRVLLVSYVEDERIVYGVSLRAAGLDTYACTDPAAAIAALPWRPDVVVTRILQPGAPFDGLELIRRIRRHPDTCLAPVIALTSFVGTFQGISSEASAPDAVLLLPCDPGQLLALIKRVLTRRSEPPAQRPLP